SSHVNDATAVLFPRPPEPQTLLDDGDRYDGGLHPSALACPGHDSRVRARVPPCDDSDPRHPVRAADLDRSRPGRQAPPRPRQVCVVAPRLLRAADNFEHGRRSNGGCAIHHPASLQFRHYRLGLRRAGLPARDGGTQSLWPRSVERAGVEHISPRRHTHCPPRRAPGKAATMSPPIADPTALARDLVRCPSVTPAEGGALGLIEGVLKAAGFEVHRVTFAEPGTAPVENLYARIGK